MLNQLKRQLNVTDWLLLIMVGVYLDFTICGGTANPENLIRFGAKADPLIQQGQWWRLITPIFLHLNFTHILFNGITLYFLGIQIERWLGHWRYLLLFMISGVVGNSTSFAFNSDLSAGASGAIFGLLGAFIMIGIVGWQDQQIRSMTKVFSGFILLNLATDVMTTGIDVANHLGGLLAGFLISWCLGVPGVKSNRKVQILALLGLIIFEIVVLNYGFES